MFRWLFPEQEGRNAFENACPKKTIQYITQSKKLTAEQALKDSLVDEIWS
jgi:3-hydroxyacyl-CoA dehydrogenase/enoyl-CoA hydratase/3-hydroxybutyryl-CoA epimerase